MKSKVSKIVALTLVASLYSTIAFAKTKTNNLNDRYTLKKIITTTGQVKVFDYGGELTIKNDMAILKTSTQQSSWNLKEVDYEIIYNELHQINPITGDKYIFEKIN